MAVYSCMTHPLCTCDGRVAKVLHVCARYKLFIDHLIQAEYENLKGCFKGELTAVREQLSKVDIQRQHNHDELEVAIADTARLSDEVLSKTQQVKQYKKQAETSKAQADVFKAQLQEERMKIQELEQNLRYLQETLHNQNEEHKEEV